MANKQVIRLTESDLRKVIKESVKNVLKESVDSVSPDSFGTSAESYHSPSDEELRQSDEFNSKYRPWSLECKDVESIIEWAFYRKDEFKSGKYDIVNLLSDLYRLI